MKVKRVCVLLLGALLLSACQPSSQEPVEEIVVSVTPDENAAPEGEEESGEIIVGEEAPEEDQGPGEPDYLVAARQINPDVVGWIKIDNTLIDYPIVQTDDNSYYIDHDIEKKDSKSGAIFLDYRNADEAQRKHMIIYGHNMKNGTMFHDLQSYKQEDFFFNHRNFTVWLYGEKREYEVISEFIVSTDVRFIQTKFDSDQAFVDFMKQLMSLSKFETGYTPSAGDEILTLCTCTYEYKSMRNVVQARRVS